MPNGFGSNRRLSAAKGVLFALVSVAAVALVLPPSNAFASGQCRTVPLQPKAATAPPSTGKLTPDLLTLVGSLRSMTPAERARGSKKRADHLAVPVYRTGGRDSSYLQVYIHLKAVSPQSLLSLRNEGVLVEYVLKEACLVQGFVPLGDVECVAELPCVTRISRPNYSICNVAQVTNQGEYVTRGDQLMETDFMRTSAGLDGTDQTVGVLSVGLFNQDFPAPANPQDAENDKRVVSGDFPQLDPATGKPSNVGGIGVFPSTDLSFLQVPQYPSGLLVLPNDLAFQPNPLPGEPPSPVDYYQQRPPIWRLSNSNIRPAGALMLEVVHDLAPNARLLFGSSRTDVEFYLNRQKLANMNPPPGVLVDDVAFPGLGRYDGTSALSQQATQIVRDKNIVVVTAVGDYTPPPSSSTSISQSVTAGGKPLFINTYFNPDPTNTAQKFHGFNNPADHHRDETLEIGVDPELGFFEAYLVWDDVWVNPKYGYTDANQEYHAKYEPAGRAADDLDMYIVDRDTLDVSRPVAYSNFIQDGRTENPVERIVTTNTGVPLSLLIRRKNSFDNRRTFMTLVITAGRVDEPQYLTHGVPMCNSDALGGVISVGSIDIRQPSLDHITADTIPGLDPGPGAMSYGRFLQWRPGAQKPDLCCYEDVVTYTSQAFNSAASRYYARGSSIAAAHVAGFCALLRQMRGDIPADQFLGLLTDTSPVDGDQLKANAVPISQEVSRQYGAAPVYKRLEAGNVYRNLLRNPDALGASSAVSTVQQFTDGPGLWTHGPDPSSGSPFALPQFSVSDGRLVLQATQLNTFGYWESPILTYVDSTTGAPSSVLSPDHLYRLKVTISSSQPDPNKVPNFRIRLITSSTDEVAELVVNSVSIDGANAPRDGQPKTYSLYYQPTPEAALYGVRAAVDMIHFSAGDDSTAALYVDQVDFDQLDAPAGSGTTQ